MRQNTQNNGSEGNKLLGQLAAQKKKVVVAFCLIAVMAFMWVKVLTRGAPQAAQAAAVEKQVEPNGQVSSQLKVSFIDLPQVAGRNDVITGDFFDIDNWQEFVGDKEENRPAGVKDVSVASRDGSEEVVRRVVGKLKLEAIVMGRNPQTFINGKLLARGDKLLISDGAGTYECEVAEIEENEVAIRCGKSQITLKLAKAIELNR